MRKQPFVRFLLFAVGLSTFTPLCFGEKKAEPSATLGDICQLVLSGTATLDPQVLMPTRTLLQGKREERGAVVDRLIEQLRREFVIYHMRPFVTEVLEVFQRPGSGGSDDVTGGNDAAFHELSDDPGVSPEYYEQLERIIRDVAVILSEMKADGRKIRPEVIAESSRVMTQKVATWAMDVKTKKVNNRRIFLENERSTKALLDHHRARVRELGAGIASAVTFAEAARTLMALEESINILKADHVQRTSDAKKWDGLLAFYDSYDSALQRRFGPLSWGIFQNYPTLAPPDYDDDLAMAFEQAEIYYKEDEVKGWDIFLQEAQERANQLNPRRLE